MKSQVRIALVMLALSGCATLGGVANSAASGCFEAANGRLPAQAGIRMCTEALANAQVAADVRGALLVNRGIVYMQAAHVLAALADYDAAILAAPNNAEAWINKGIVLLQIGGRDADVVTVLTQALTLAPQRPELAYYHRAIANEGLGRLRDAFNDYAEAAQLAPQWAEPANQLQRFKFVRRKTLAG